MPAPKKDTNTKAEATIPDENFVPYVCHYDPNTILTKDGELIQIIRVAGFHESVVGELISLRDSIRDSLRTHIKDNDFALWFTTIRRKKNIVPKGEFKESFCDHVNDIWVQQNSWNNQYVNELYISIIVQGIDTSISNFKTLIRSFSYFATRKLHSQHLKKMHQKLCDLTSKITRDIEGYGATLLGMKERNGILYSEATRFFGKITNLYEDHYPVACEDMSHILTSHELAFGGYNLEVIGNNNKNYAAMFSLKEYSEIINDNLDDILQLPFEFIITQSFDFIQHGKDLQHYKYQDYILNVSSDNEMKLITNLEKLTKKKSGLPTDFGELQTTFMIISHEKRELEKDITAIIKRFSDLGIVAIRENIFMEHCFWSQLPGNFAFIRRQKTIDLDSIAGFAALYNFPAGTIDDNYWGPSVTVLHTILNTPYFFSFHDGIEGHSMILGDSSSQKSILLNFLIAQSMRFDPKIFYFDFKEVAKSFINIISGKYYKLTHHQDPFAKHLDLNIIASLKSPQDSKFLTEFFQNLARIGKGVIPDKELNLISSIIPNIIADKNTNDLRGAIEFFNTKETINLYSRLKNLYRRGINRIFDTKSEINWQDQIIAFDLTEIYDKKTLLEPLVHYLLYQIEKTLQGQPSIVVFNEAWELLDNKIMAPKINDMLTRFKEKNCITIFSAFESNDVAGSPLNQQIIGHFTSKMIFPDYEITEIERKFYSDILQMTKEELKMLEIMDTHKKQFLLKHGHDSVIIALDFPYNIEIPQILANDEDTKKVISQIFHKYCDANQEIAREAKIAFLQECFLTLRKIEQEKIEKEQKLIRKQKLEELRAFNTED